MIEPYQWLCAHANECGFPPTNIGPASVDLSLGEVKVYNRYSYKFDMVKGLHNGMYRFYPGNFYLCSTLEYIKVPPTHCAFVNMRSSLARRGLGHKMAGFIDPGFEGQVTLELSTDAPVDVLPGERIVQIIYSRLTEITEKVYSGKYKGQIGATEAYEV